MMIHKATERRSTRAAHEAEGRGKGAGGGVRILVSIFSTLHSDTCVTLQSSWVKAIGLKKPTLVAEPGGSVPLFANSRVGEL